MPDIREVTTDDELRESMRIIHVAFAPVAQELGITRESWPQCTGFITLDALNLGRLGGDRYFGLFDDETQVGFVAIPTPKEGHCHFGRLAVLPEHQHKGYGRQLVQFVMDYARKAGVTKVSLGMANANDTLRRWYEGLGFHVTEVRKLDHVPCAICMMEMDLE
jgi:diamine N-acetyltransferase